VIEPDWFRICQSETLYPHTNKYSGVAKRLALHSPRSKNAPFCTSDFGTHSEPQGPPDGAIPSREYVCNAPAYFSLAVPRAPRTSPEAPILSP
jgi:hypothetical protein